MVSTVFSPSDEALHRRENMVAHQVARRGVLDRRVLQAMVKVPREAFVAEELEEFAYDDSPLPIAEGQTISQPYIVAAMAEAAELKSGDKVLEVGAGSGYAAAIFAELVDQVFTIERREALADSARSTLVRLGYSNVQVRAGDGTRGWPEEAPFDAIIVAASGPRIPDSLKNQLAVGGRLILPVGQGRQQSLRKITRVANDKFDERDLGAVLFVPLIGAEGWSDPTGENRFERPIPLPERIRLAAEPLPPPGDPWFGSIVDRFAASARVILLGEATHGTSEFYLARAAITRRLVEHHGYRIIAAEADWPDAAAIDRHIRLKPHRTTERPFQRFPTWMWRNVEMQSLVDWLRDHNERKSAEERAGFFGLDIYNMTASIASVLAYLDRIDPEAAKIARERYGCLTPWQQAPAVYGRAVLTSGYRKCEGAVVRQCRELLEKQLQYAAEDGDEFLDATQNAKLVASAERYYREMYYGSHLSWNLRDKHMFETLVSVLDAHEPDAKAVVWAHNSHVGDARFTEMGVVREELNLGQLCRERFGAEAVLIGFGTHHGEVAAAPDWDEDMQVMKVLPSRQNSYERLCHDARSPRFLLDLREGRHDALRKELASPRLERFIGVVYRPETELLSHYADASLPQQFDAYIWFDRTHAVTPLGPQHARPGAPDTWPFGV
jgi:protein-L-isoaspartate(D-aspartate) O-methyltransferase